MTPTKGSIRKGKASRVRGVIEHAYIFNGADWDRVAVVADPCSQPNLYDVVD